MNAATTDRTAPGTAGFTLLEMIVVLAVVSVLAGTAVPLAAALVQADRRQEARTELGELAVTLDAYWFEQAAFPASLRASGFFGMHLQPGAGNTAVVDPFGAGQDYVYVVDTAAGTATVRSRGENGVDDGAAEELTLVVHAAAPGTRRTRLRFRLVPELLARHIASGGSTAGPWSSLRAAIGLDATHDTDGWGTPLQWTEATHSLVSAGADRTFGTSDDLNL